MKNIANQIYNINDINKEFNVILLKKLKEVEIVLKNNTKAVMAVLVPKENHRPPRAPKWFEAWSNNEFKPFKQEMLDFKTTTNKRLDKIEQRLDNIVKVNNLKE